MIRVLFIVLLAAPMLSGCLSMDAADYMEDAGAGEPYASSRRDCSHASDIAGSSGSAAAEEAYRLCMEARGWSRP